jgi:hypothetical protein
MSWILAAQLIYADLWGFKERRQATAEQPTVLYPSMKTLDLSFNQPGGFALFLFRRMLFLTELGCFRSASAGSNYQIRLFCCSEDYYSPGTAYPYGAAKPYQPRGPAPVEFPPVCEVRLNGQMITANLRGIKKKEGTVNPPNLSDLKKGSGVEFAMNLAPGAINRVELAYANTEKVCFGISGDKTPTVR